MDQTVERFQLIEANQLLLPHKCSTCGGFSNRKFIDFGLWVEFYGNVYICNECFLGAAKVIDCVPIDNYNKVVFQNEELKAIIRQILDENKGLRDAVDGLRITSSSYTDSNSLIGIPLVQAEQSKGGSNMGASKRKEGPFKPTDERRSENLRFDDPADPLTDIGLTI